MIWRLLVVSLLWLAYVTSHETYFTAAQQSRFEVISIKRAQTNDRRGRSFVFYPGGRFVATKVPFGMLLGLVYGFPRERIVNAPRWAESQMFDIQAIGMWDAPPSTAESRPFVKQMLAEQFALRVHTEQRPSEVYALVLARSDGKTGPALRRANDECGRRAAAKLEIPLPRFPAPGQRPDCGITSRVAMGVRQLRLGGTRISALLSQIDAVAVLGGPVVDRTGLDGPFDIELDYVPPSKLEVDPKTTEQANGPSLTEALRTQLGLKFTKRQEQVEFLVIDHVQMPSSN